MEEKKDRYTFNNKLESSVRCQQTTSIQEGILRDVRDPGNHLWSQKP